LDPETHHYEFGPYRIDSTERLLRRGDELISLPPKVIDTLLVLVSNSGRMVEKEALMQTVWPDITVEPNSIAKNVSLLRKTFGDTSDEPRYIETISKRGYRFVAIVRSSSAAVDERASPPVPPVLSYYKVAVAVLAVGLGLFLTWAYFHDRSLHSLVVLPLADLSPNPQDFFAKGMTEALHQPR